MFQIIDLNFSEPASGGRALALGMFDGVHLGHRAVISNALEYSRAQGLISAATTFAEPPIRWTSPETQVELISTLEERLQLFKNIGLNQAIVLDFPQISELSFENYLNELLKEQLNCKFLSFGPNHYFGKNRGGGPNEIASWAAQNAIEVKQTEVKHLGELGTISSSGIRRLLKQGDLPNANLLLGHKFLIVQKLIEGQKLGRQLGFPTLNFNYPPGKVPLPFGVYAAWVFINKEAFPAALNYGFGPTLKQISKPILECHLLAKVSQELLPKIGDSLQIELVKYIRPEQKFASTEALQAQIKDDCQRILEILG